MKPIAIFFIAAVLASGGCKSPPAAGPIDFARDVLPIFRQHCIQCHGDEEQESRLELTSLAAILTGGDSGPAIFPGQPDKSLLLEMAREEKMPPDPPHLSHKDINLLHQWITTGAR